MGQAVDREYATHTHTLPACLFVCVCVCLVHFYFDSYWWLFGTVLSVCAADFEFVHLVASVCTVLCSHITLGRAASYRQSQSLVSCSPLK